MPFTPFHMGPAVAAKAVLGRHFSIPVYGFTQVAIDVEVLAGFPFRRDLSFHQVMHTVGGGTAAAILALALLRPALRPGARLWNRLTGAQAGSIWYMEPQVSPLVAIVSAFIGAWGHVLLDAPTHSHMEPLAPVARGNPFDGLISYRQTMAWCVGLGAIGGGVILARWHSGQRSGRASDMARRRGCKR